MDFTEYVNKLTEDGIKERRDMDAADGEPIMSDADYRLAVYEDLRDTLKYIFSDVAYG